MGISAAFLILPIVFALAQTEPGINIMNQPSTDSSGNITYTIKVSNTGTAAATDVFIRSTLDSNVDYVSSDPMADISSTANSQMTLTWHVPTIMAGNGYNIILKTLPKPGTAVDTTVTNQVKVESDNFATATASSQTSTTIFFEPGIMGGQEYLPTTGVGMYYFVALVIALGLGSIKWLRLLPQKSL